MKASERTPGTCLNLDGVRIPALSGFSHSRRAHVPNLVRDVWVNRVNAYVVLGDFRIMRFRKNEDVALRDRFCLCASTLHDSYFCPEHEFHEFTCEL